MPKPGFFTSQMGRRLRSLRTLAGLTQLEVADRMGLSGRYRRRTIGRLECGRSGEPALSLIARYLQACGARWSSFSDLLEAVPPVKADHTLINSSDRSERKK